MTATAPCPLPVRARRSAEEPPVADLPTAELVCAARRRDHGAWEELVGRYGGMVRGVASSYRLSESDVADVAQNTWLRAFERLDTLREADRVGGWLATIARRECLAVLRRSVREVTDGLLDKYGEMRVVDSRLNLSPKISPSSTSSSSSSASTIGKY